MFRYLDKLRKKSYQEKQSFAFFTSIGITGFIFAIWLMTLLYSFDDSSSTKNTASPLSAFTNQIKVIFSGKEVYNSDTEK